MHIYVGLVASVIGLAVSIYIYRKKARKSKLFCPRQMKGCDKVVNSTHGRTFGVPKELLGILYYAVVLIVFAISYMFPMFISGMRQELFTILIVTGFLFSVHLILLQAFVIRSWCMWCLLSALAATSLLIALLGFPHDGLAAILADQKDFWLNVHNITLGFVLAGAMTINVAMIRQTQKRFLNSVLNLTWILLAALIISIIMYAIPGPVSTISLLVESIGVLIITTDIVLCNIFSA